MPRKPKSPAAGHDSLPPIPPHKIQRLRARLPKKKLFVALAGNIGAGKTTAAKLLSQSFGFELFDEPVIDNRFLAHYYADMRRWSFTLQLEFLLRRIEHHELIGTSARAACRIAPCYEDPEIFAKYLHGLGHMTDAELQLYLEYFQRLAREIQQPDKVICFDVPDVERAPEAHPHARPRGGEGHPAPVPAGAQRLLLELPRGAA